MGPRAELALRMTSRRMSVLVAAPLSALQRNDSNLKSMDVRVRLAETESGAWVDLDGISIEDDRPTRAVREIPDAFFLSAQGRQVQLILECDRVWVPAETLPGSSDVRKLTLQVLQAGFEDGS
jgi:hypothetical protein